MSSTDKEEPTAAAPKTAREAPSLLHLLKDRVDLKQVAKTERLEPIREKLLSDREEPR